MTTRTAGACAAPYDSDGKKRFTQSGHTDGARTTLYRLAEVQKAAQNNEPILLVESEKDVLAGNFHKADRLRYTALRSSRSPTTTKAARSGRGRWPPPLTARHQHYTVHGSCNVWPSRGQAIRALRRVFIDRCPADCRPVAAGGLSHAL